MKEPHEHAGFPTWSVKRIVGHFQETHGKNPPTRNLTRLIKLHDQDHREEQSQSKAQV